MNKLNQCVFIISSKKRPKKDFTSRRFGNVHETCDFYVNRPLLQKD
jgi:hypothetical protein